MGNRTNVFHMSFQWYVSAFMFKLCQHITSCIIVTKHLIVFIVVISPQVGNNVICALLLHVIIHKGMLIFSTVHTNFVHVKVWENCIVCSIMINLWGDSGCHNKVNCWTYQFAATVNKPIYHSMIVEAKTASSTYTHLCIQRRGGATKNLHEF